MLSVDLGRRTGRERGPGDGPRARADRMRSFRPVHRSGYDRKADDYYPTPGWVTACLLRHVRFRGAVWEPCCGDGAIARVLQDHGYSVTASDAAEYGFGLAGVNFFDCTAFPPDCG